MLAADAGEPLINRLAIIYKMYGKYEQALVLFEKRLVLCRKDCDKAGEGRTLNNISGVYQARGEYDRALAYLQQSLRISRKIGYKAGITSTLHNMAIIYHSKKDIKKFIEYETEAYKITVETKDAMGLYNVGRDLGETLCRMGNKKEGGELLKRSYEIGKQAGFPDVEEIKAILKEFGEIK